MIKTTEKIKSIEYDKNLNLIVIRTNRKTNYEKVLMKKITTSGCAQGTIFGNIYDQIKKTKIKSKISSSFNSICLRNLCNSISNC